MKAAHFKASDTIGRLTVEIARLERQFDNIVTALETLSRGIFDNVKPVFQDATK